MAKLKSRKEKMNALTFENPEAADIAAVAEA